MSIPSRHHLCLYSRPLFSRGTTTGFNLQYNIETIFGKNGYFDYTLQALGIDSDFANIDPNTKISSLFYKVLGSTDFPDNLQLLTAKENSLKGAIWGLYKNINADKKWNKMSPTTCLDVLWRVKTVVDYLNKEDVQDSLEETRATMLAILVLPNFIPVGTGLSLEDALDTWYRDHFQAMTDNLVEYVQRRLPDMITFWQNTAGQNLHGATNTAAIVIDLVDFQNNAGTYLAIATTSM